RARRARRAPRARGSSCAGRRAPPAARARRRRARRSRWTWSGAGSSPLLRLLRGQALHEVALPAQEVEVGARAALLEAVAVLALALPARALHRVAGVVGALEPLERARLPVERRRSIERREQLERFAVASGAPAGDAVLQRVGAVRRL